MPLARSLGDFCLGQSSDRANATLSGEETRLQFPRVLVLTPCSKEVTDFKERREEFLQAAHGLFQEVEVLSV